MPILIICFGAFTIITDFFTHKIPAEILHLATFLFSLSVFLINIYYDVAIITQNKVFEKGIWGFVTLMSLFQQFLL